MNMRDKARHLRKNMTPEERILWCRLCGRQLLDCKFRRQEPIGLYIADFVCLSRRLIVEVDGDAHVEAEARDEKRTAHLSGGGYRILRFGNEEVRFDLTGVLRTIADAIVLRPERRPRRRRANMRRRW